MKIKTSIAIIFISFSILLLSFISFIFYKTGERFLLSEIYNHLEFLSVTKAKSIENFINKKHQVVNLISNDEQIAKNILAYNKNPIKKNQSILISSLKKIGSENIKIHAFDPNGKIIASSINAFQGKNYDKNLFVKTEDGRNNFLLVAGKDSLSQTLYVISPVFLKQEWIGSIGIEQDGIELISQLSDYSGLGSSGEFFFIDERKKIYLSPLRYDRRAAMKKIVSVETEHELDKKILRKRNFSISYDYRNELVIESSKKISVKDWALITKMDFKEILLPVENFKRSVLFIFISAVLMSIALGIILSNYLSRPIEHLIKEAKKILKGDYSERMPLKHKNELATLTGYINQMASIVEKTKDELRTSNKTLIQYSYLILHDLRNPIISLATLNKLLKEEFREKINKEGQEILEMQESKIAQLNQLIQGLYEAKSMEDMKEKELPLNDNN